MARHLGSAWNLQRILSFTHRILLAETPPARIYESRHASAYVRALGVPSQPKVSSRLCTVLPSVPLSLPPLAPFYIQFLPPSLRPDLSILPTKLLPPPSPIQTILVEHHGRLANSQQRVASNIMSSLIVLLTRVLINSSNNHNKPSKAVFHRQKKEAGRTRDMFGVSLRTEPCPSMPEQNFPFDVLLKRPSTHLGTSTSLPRRDMAGKEYSFSTFPLGRALATCTRDRQDGSDKCYQALGEGKRALAPELPCR